MESQGFEAKNLTGIADKKLSLRIGPAVCLPGLVRSFGKDPAPVFAAAQIDEALFSNPENRVSIESLAKCAAEIARLIERPDLGLLISKEYNQHSLGLILLLAQEGPDVRTALLNIARLLQHHNECAYLSVTETETDAFLKYELRDADFEGADIVIVTALGNALRVMRELCGTAWCPAEVRFSMSKPANVAPFEAYFGAPVRFESPFDALVFPRRWLAHHLTRVARANGHEDLLMTWDFADHVRHQIAMRIGLEPVTAPIVAAALCLSRRVLDRRLATLNVTFSQLLDEVRFARARRLLSAGRAPLAEVSLALGYAEPSAFSRAFRAWAGTSPQAWRETHSRVNDMGNRVSA